jgi:hypothetical protein
MTVIRKFIGLLLLIAAVIGLIFSILGIAFLWRIQGNIATNIQSSVDLLSQTLQTTSQGLDVTYSALDSTVSTIRSLESTVETIAVTVKSSTPLVDEIRILMDVDLPNTITATQESLNSAAKSAKVIDSLLSTFSSLPLIGASLKYDPQVPLSESLSSVADSLSSLPVSFKSMQTDLVTTTTNMVTFESDLTVMAKSIGEIETSVGQYHAVIVGYQKSLDGLRLQLDLVHTNIPTIVRFLLIALTIFLGWMAIANLGILTQGWELLTEGSMHKEVQEAIAENNAKVKEEEPEPASEKKDPET